MAVLGFHLDLNAGLPDDYAGTYNALAKMKEKGAKFIVAYCTGADQLEERGVEDWVSYQYHPQWGNLINACWQLGMWLLPYHELKFDGNDYPRDFPNPSKDRQLRPMIQATTGAKQQIGRQYHGYGLQVMDKGQPDVVAKGLLTNTMNLMKSHMIDGDTLPVIQQESQLFIYTQKAYFESYYMTTEAFATKSDTRNPRPVFVKDWNFNGSVAKWEDVVIPAPGNSATPGSCSYEYGVGREFANVKVTEFGLSGFVKPIIWYGAELGSVGSLEKVFGSVPYKYGDVVVVDPEPDTDPDTDPGTGDPGTGGDDPIVIGGGISEELFTELIGSVDALTAQVGYNGSVSEESLNEMKQSVLSIKAILAETQATLLRIEERENKSILSRLLG